MKLKIKVKRNVKVSGYEFRMKWKLLVVNSGKFLLWKNSGKFIMVNVINFWNKMDNLCYIEIK